MAGSTNLIGKLLHRLSANEALLLREIIAVADDAGVAAYAVGGTARDLLLGVESLDLDVAVDGGALDLARSVAQRTGARVVKTTRFGTASLKLGVASIDVATTREETYATPGALPTTYGGTIEADLVRRDFTINALALRLNGAAAGELLDPSGGRQDLRDKVVRVLHEASLRDDPTRIIRAARYEQRLGFTIHAHTEALIRNHLEALDTISGTRIRQEIERTLREDKHIEMLLRMDTLGVLSAIQPGLTFGNCQAAAMRCLSEGDHDTMLSRWAIVGWAAPDDEIERLCTRLAPSGRLRDVLRSLPAVTAVAREVGRAASASAVAERFRPLPAPTVAALACAAKEPDVRELALDYVDRIRYIRPSLNGDDLISLGVPEGPQVGRVLARLRDARIDGTATNREDELAIVRREISQRKAPDAT
jgi:tRNA nucleotidyltransferase (CCA-adding enzyme)